MKEKIKNVQFINEENEIKCKVILEEDRKIEIQLKEEDKEVYLGLKELFMEGVLTEEEVDKKQYEIIENYIKNNINIKEELNKREETFSDEKKEIKQEEKKNIEYSIKTTQGEEMIYLSEEDSEKIRELKKKKEEGKISEKEFKEKEKEFIQKALTEKYEKKKNGIFHINQKELKNNKIVTESVIKNEEIKDDIILPIEFYVKTTHGERKLILNIEDTNEIRKLRNLKEKGLIEIF
jgi:hypothetical protein